MSFFNEKDLEEILISGEFDRLIGKYENEWFDCKKQPYALTTEKGKHDLAKDISAFANVDGGYILIGAKGENDTTHSGEQIKSISIFEESFINVEQNIKILEDRIFPNIQGIEINWFPSKEDNTKGLVLIKIPPQQESDKPFLNKKIFDEQGNKISETNIGFFQRRGDKISHFELKDLHRLIKLGQDYEKNISRRFDALELRFNDFTNIPLKDDLYKRKEDLNRKLEERINSTLIKTNQDKEPTLVLSGITNSNQKIKDFNFSGQVQKLAVKGTVPFRDGGWKLLYSASQITDSLGLIEFGYNSKSLSVYDDGGAVYISNLDQISLIDNPSKIIPIALIEVVYGFADFYSQFVNLLEEDFNVLIRVELNNVKNEEFVTFLSWDLRPNHFYDSFSAPEDSFSFEIEKDKNFMAKVLTFEIIRNIYHFFGINPMPPFSKNENGIDVIDINQLPK